MDYRARRPHGRLRGIVDLLWRIAEADPTATPQTICPDGRTEIVLHLGAPMRQIDGESSVLQPRHILVGQMTTPLAIAPTGPATMVGARLAPSALHRLLPLPQDELAGKVTDVSTVWNAWTRRAVDELACARTPDAQLDVLERALERLVIPHVADDVEDTMMQSVATFEASGGRMSITSLASQIGLSRRQYERHFRVHVGLSPRLFGRIVRFQRAFGQLGHDSAAAIATRCGYADQAHLIREVRRFAGQTPSSLAKAEGLTSILR